MSKFVPRKIVKQTKQIDLLTYFMNNNPTEFVRLVIPEKETTNKAV